MTLATDLALAMLAAAGLLCVARVARRGSLADRVVGLDSTMLVVVSGIAVHSARTGSVIFLDALVVVALLGFTGTALVARFIERRGV